MGSAQTIQYRSEIQQLMHAQVRKCEATARTNCYKALNIMLKKRYPGHEGLYRVTFNKTRFVVEYVLDAVNPKLMPTAIGRYVIHRKGLTLGEFR